MTHNKQKDRDFLQGAPEIRRCRRFGTKNGQTRPNQRMVDDRNIRILLFWLSPFFVQGWTQLG